MSILKRVASVALALTMVAGMSAMPVFAAEVQPENGDYTATIHFHNASNPANYSMCDPIFAHTADVELTDDAAKLTFYVAYPIPAFSDQGADGTIKDVKFTFNGTKYLAESDIASKAVKTFDTAGALFGINAGDKLATQKLSVSLPRVAVDSFDDGMAASAYVNVFMNSTTDFVVKVTDMTKAETPSASDTKSATVTAEVAAPSATYNVTIPESVAMGTLSATEDNTKEYTIAVTAENLGSGKVEIATDVAGKLKSGENVLTFANNFGTQSTSKTAELTGTISVKAADVAKAAAGNYTGTANFTINYYAGK